MESSSFGYVVVVVVISAPRSGHRRPPPVLTHVLEDRMHPPQVGGCAIHKPPAVDERLGIHRLLSHDQRHFHAVQPRGFDHFVLLPADLA